MVQGFQGILAVGVLALCGRIALFVVTSEDALPAASANPVPSSVWRAEVAVTRFGVIADRDLFHRKVEVPAVPEAPPMEESALDVKLLGTLVAARARGTSPSEADTPPPAETKAEAAMSSSSVALVRDVDGKVVTLAKGDLFADQRAKLVAIEPRRIVLEQKGHLETVTLEEGASSAPGAQRTAYSAPTDPASVAAATNAAKIAGMQREVQRRMREAMPEAESQASDLP